MKTFSEKLLELRRREGLSQEQLADRLGERVEELSQYFRGWRYIWESKTRVFGLPLVSIRFHSAPHGMRARDTARGIIAIGNIAVGYDAAGEHILFWGDGLTYAQAEAFLLEQHPDLWKPLLKLLAFFGANIK